MSASLAKAAAFARLPYYNDVNKSYFRQFADGEV